MPGAPIGGNSVLSGGFFFFIVVSIMVSMLLPFIGIIIDLRRSDKQRNWSVEKEGKNN